MFRYITVISILMFISGCGEQQENNTAGEISSTTGLAVEYDDSVVVTVGDRVITGAILSPVFERFNGDSLMVNLKLDALVSRLLILQDAHHRGFDSTRDMELFSYEREREQLQSAWIEWILNEKVELPQDTVEKYYSQMGTILIYRAITVPDRAFCDSLRQLIINGENMGDLAGEYTTILPEIPTRGVVGPVDFMETHAWDYPLLQGLEIGELSSIDSSRSGWRFVRIDSVYQDSVPDIEEIREQISVRILGRMRMAYKERLLDSLGTLNNLQISEGIPELIADHYTGNGHEFESFSSDQEDMVAYTFTGGERTLYSFVENIKNLPYMSDIVLDDTDWIKGYGQLLGTYDILAMEAKKLEMDTLPEIVSYMDQRLGNELLDIYYDEVIGPGLVPTEDELREIYETEQDSLVIPEERTFRTIAAVGEEQMDMLQQVIESGGDPYSIAEDLTSVQSILAPGESLITAPMTRSEIPAPYSEMLFSAEMNETVICSIAADRVLVFETIEIDSEHNAAFEESQGQLTAMFQSRKEEQVISGLVDSLSSVYHIEIDRGFIDKFIYAGVSSINQP